MRVVFGAVVAAVFLVGCATPASTDSSKQLASADTGEKKICKSVPVMGSNFPQKVCSTQAEWDAFNKKTHESVDSFDEQRKAGNTQGGFENQ